MEINIQCNPEEIREIKISELIEEPKWMIVLKRIIVKHPELIETNTAVQQNKNARETIINPRFLSSK